MNQQEEEENVKALAQGGPYQQIDQNLKHLAGLSQPAQAPSFQHMQFQRSEAHIALACFIQQDSE